MITVVIHHRGWVITVRARVLGGGAPTTHEAIAILEKFTIAEDPALVEREKNLRRIYGVNKACESEAEVRSLAVEAAKRAIDLLY